jgi:hypothetical protein
MDIDTEDLGGTGTPVDNAPQPSLREQLEDSFAKARDDSDNTPEPGRTRDQGGRFAKPAPQEGTQQPTTAPEPVATLADAPADPAATAAPTAAPAAAPAGGEIAAPASWTAELKAKWSTVPPDVRAYIAEREDQVHRQFSRNDEERNFGRVMSQTLQPYAETLRAIGATPDQAVSGLLNVDNVLRKGTPEQKLEMVHEIMRSYQIPLEAVTQHQPLPQDPRLGALQQQLQALQNQMAQGSQQQQAAVEERAAQAELEAFKANAPHLEAVRPMMAQLLTSGVATGLQDAYDQAAWAHPEVRKLMLAQQTAATSNVQRVARARAAGASISGAPGNATPNTAAPKRTLREELKANLSEAQSRI